MVKLYLRYRHASSFGVIASGASNSVFDKEGKLAVCPALEDVIVWDVKRAVEVARWHDDDNKAEVTCIARSPDGDTFAIGYTDGSIRLWKLSTNTTTTTFTGHKTSVTSLSFDKKGHRLASGSKDTDLVVWDVLSESGLYRLRGHKDQVTGVRFLESGGVSGVVLKKSKKTTKGGDDMDEDDDEAEKLISLDHIVSCSKDGMLKFWDLATQHCVETVIGHRGEVWAMEVLSFWRGGVLVDSGGGDDNEYESTATKSHLMTLVTGGSEGEVRVWKLDGKVLASKLEAVGGSVQSSWTQKVLGDVGEGDDEEGKAKKAADTWDPIAEKSLISFGVLERQSKERVVSIKVHDSGRYLAVQGADRLVELYKFRTEAELKKRAARLKKRQREKKKTDMEVDGADDDESTAATLTIQDVIPPLAALKSSTTSSTTQQPITFKILCALTTNQIEVHVAGLESKEEPTRQEIILDRAGHPTDIRTLALSSDDQNLLSGSHSGIKIWNLESKQCVGSIDSGYALCSSFIPGNNHAIIGTKSGELELAYLEFTGSADKEVKFWEFGLTDDSVGGDGDNNGAPKRRRLTLVHTRTLKLSDDVLAVRHSHDGKLLAVSLLDCTVKVFYADTLKFFLSLYGHKLPVLSMDISSDGSLIVTGSADKSIKIWGLDFGDCHRSLRAHEDSVMCCRFVFGTHYVLSAGKDKVIKYWYADKFEQIMKMDGHHGEVWALAVGKYGSVVVSASHDRSIRLWEKTEEQFVLEEEREREMEEMYDRAAVEDDDRYEGAIGSGVTTDADIDGLSKQLNGVSASGATAEVGDAGRKTAESLKAGERISAALEIWEEETDMMNLYKNEMQRYRERYEALKNSGSSKSELKAFEEASKPKIPKRNPFVVSANVDKYPPEMYVLRVLEGVRSADLEQALLVLSFTVVVKLIKVIVVWTEYEWNLTLTCRVLFYLLDIHFNQLVTSRACRPMLVQIRTTLEPALRRQRDRIGFNMAALKFLKKEWEAEHTATLDDPIFGGSGSSASANASAPAPEEKKGKGEKGGVKRKRVVVKSK
ncbi:hypothetical protein HDU76_002636 [Blyttiomyces sp. JEL0837]|nr:hypothetical protein HDU76_002636 [Blyttiomyces sp. JEL0837]